MGVNSFVKFCKIGALSATGTRPFGDGADGFVMGEGSATFVLKRLADGNRAYRERHGVIFIICATGLSAEAMLTTLERRLPNDTTLELLNAAIEQERIMQLRLAAAFVPQQESA